MVCGMKEEKNWKNRKRSTIGHESHNSLGGGDQPSSTNLGLFNLLFYLGYFLISNKPQT